MTISFPTNVTSLTCLTSEIPFFDQENTFYLDKLYFTYYMHTGLQWKFIRYKQQTDDYYAFINFISILHLYYIVMFCSVLKHINPRQMHVNANHVKFPFNSMPLYVNITSIIVYRLWRCWTVRLFMATSFTTKRKGKKKCITVCYFALFL